MNTDMAQLDAYSKAAKRHHPSIVTARALKFVWSPADGPAEHTVGNLSTADETHVFVTPPPFSTGKAGFEHR
jgi:hypothetical protein